MTFLLNKKRAGSKQGGHKGKSSQRKTCSKHMQTDSCQKSTVRCLSQWFYLPDFTCTFSPLE